MELPVFYCEYKTNFVDSSGTSPHNHATKSEIIQTFEEDGKILINGKLYNIQKNGLFFINSSSTHFVSPIDTAKYNHSIIILNTPKFIKLCEALNLKLVFEEIFEKEGGSFCELSPEEVIEVDSIFLKIHRLMSDEDNFKYAKLSALLTKLLEIGIKNQNTNIQNGTLNSVLSYVSSNALEKITISDISAHTNINKYYLCRMFKEKMGVTIGDFIRTRRISYAKQLLISTNLSITKIAQECCFSDNSYFTKTFLKETNLTPSQYRIKYK